MVLPRALQLRSLKYPKGEKLRDVRYKVFLRQKNRCETDASFFSPYLRFFEANGTNWSASKPKIRSRDEMLQLLRNIKNIGRA